MRFVLAIVRGERGIAWWLGAHTLLYIVLLNLLSVYWSVSYAVSEDVDDVWRLLAGVPIYIFVALWPFLPLTLAATVMMTLITWTFRESSRVRFRALALLLCGVLPLCSFVIAPNLLWIAVPVQVAYGVLIQRPRWVHPLDLPSAEHKF